jgi:hypothetical protein
VRTQQHSIDFFHTVLTGELLEHGIAKITHASLGMVPRNGSWTPSLPPNIVVSVMRFLSLGRHDKVPKLNIS